MRYRCAQAVVLLAFTTTILAGCGTSTGGAPPAAATSTSSMSHATHATDGAGSPSTPTTAAAPDEASAQVVIDNFAYTPRTLTVAAGTRVTWVNHDDVPHTVTSTAKPRTLDSGPMDTDATFAFVFTAPGTYEYFCAVHPHMTAKVIVK